MKITVLIPTYRRPEDLQRCLAALAKQQRPADEVRVVVRDADVETLPVLGRFEADGLPIAVTTVREVGVVAAMNAGLRDAAGDVIALTDDDTAPWPDWLARIEETFRARPGLAGVGGRDWVYRGEELLDGADPEAGMLRWYGRLVGQHHLAVGAPRRVDVLKGANCAYRAEVLRQVGFDTRMRGSGAQVHWELRLGLSLKRLDAVLWFDPGICVDHGRGKRFDEDQRDTFSAIAVQNAVHNETLVLLEHFSPVRRVVFLLWAVLIGTRVAPGLMQVPRLIATGDRHAVARWKATIAGRISALLGGQWHRTAVAAATVTASPDVAIATS